MKSFNLFTGMRNLCFQIEPEHLLYYAEHEHHSAPVRESLITQSLDTPYGGQTLNDIPQNASVLIIVDDATRPPPSAAILKHLIPRVEKRTRNITFITAPGTHRPLTTEELLLKIGSEYMDIYPIINTNYKNEDDYKYIGKTELGTPLHIHKAVLAADYKIAIGNITIHNVVGWSGGAKIIQPGVSGEITTADTHLRGSHYRLLDIFGNINCHMRKEIDAIGERVGLDFIANTVLNEEQQILGLFCGHYLEAHRAGVTFAEQAMRPAIPALADIVIVSANPCFLDYWQGFKPLGFSMFGVKEGGTIIYLFDPPEGLCGNSPAHKETLETYLRSNAETVYQDLDNGKVKDTVGIANPLCHFQVLEHANVICVTEQLTDAECDLLTFKKTSNVEIALKIARQQHGENAKIGVIPVGGETLVRVSADK